MGNKKISILAVQQAKEENRKLTMVLSVWITGG